jgi:hypothetical protein
MLVVVVLALATFLLAAWAGADWAGRRNQPTSLATRHDWGESGLLEFELYNLPDYVVRSFADPLVSSNLPFLAGRLVGSPLEAWLAAREVPHADIAYAVTAIGLGRAIGMLIVAALLGWMADLARGRPVRRVRDYLGAYYLPLLLLAVCVGFGGLLSKRIATAWVDPLTGSRLRFLFWYRSFWLSALLLLVLAPFAIAGRSLGAWGGVKAGAALLWRNRLPMLGLFLLYRVAAEVSTFAYAALLPGGSVLFSHPDFWQYWLSIWPAWITSAVLGLWLAAAFTLVVRGDAAEGQEQAPALPAVPAP